MDIGMQLGPYTIEAVLGQGAQSQVFRGRHRDLGIARAIKVLNRQGSEARRRFLLEASTLAQLRHPRIVGVIDVLREGPTLALVLECVDGPDLRRWCCVHCPPLHQRLQIFAEVVRAIDEVHRRGLVHRDLKMSNILVEAVRGAWAPKVIDFGVAKLPGGSTRTGLAIGSLTTMAPEQMRDSSSVDLRADLYALGVILYELVCGDRPFAGDPAGVQEAYEERMRGRWVPLSKKVPGISPALSDLVDDLLSPEPSDRPQRCDDVLTRLYSVPCYAVAAARFDRDATTRTTAASHPPSTWQGEGARRGLRVALTMVVGLVLIGLTAASFAGIDRQVPPRNEPVSLSDATPPGDPAGEIEACAVTEEGRASRW